MSQYPEHEKLHKIAKLSQAQGEFYHWLIEEKGFRLCEIREYEGSTTAAYMPIWVKLEDLLCEYHDIDPRKIDEEKEQMLAEIRTSSNNKKVSND